MEQMLDQKLIEYAQSNIYPFHMPGHKRNFASDTNPYAIDITEIDGFDNLHHAEEILKEAQARSARLYGSKRAFYLINGSTCGLLAAVSAAVPKKGELLVARNCHKAVYHAMYLREIKPHYLYPSITNEGIACAITPEEVKEALCEYPNIKAVLITSPTYDGIVSDIEAIATIVHEKGIPLIVDEAHGAHFGLEKASPCFPDTAVHLGADLVIQSLHKTLPSFTQTALLHICSDRIEERKVEQFLDIYETSSPSYVFMAGMERCIRMMGNEGDALLKALKKHLDEFIKKMCDLKSLRVLTKDNFDAEKAYDFDASKLLIYTGNAGITGKELADWLLNEYQLQMEMATGDYVLAMTSVMDQKEGFDRLAEALLAIDQRLTGEKRPAKNFPEIYKKQEQVCTIAEAIDAKHDISALKDAVGLVTAEAIYLYPPGIPILAPGERITKKVMEDIYTCEKEGFLVHGLLPDKRIEVVNFS